MENKKGKENRKNKYEMERRSPKENFEGFIFPSSGFRSSCF